MTRATTPAQPHSRHWRTALTRIEPNRVVVRGYGLDELMGRASFAEVIHVLLTGELPTRSIGMLLDAMLVSFVDHGVTPPSTLAARNAATTGASLRGSVAAGILGFGRHHGGDVLACRELLDRGLALVRAGQTPAEAAAALADALAASGDIPPPGFGHRYHSVDPRATRLLQLAHELEVDQAHTRLLRALEHAFGRHEAFAGRSLPINVDGAVAAICADLGLAPEIADTLLIVSRVPGLAAHSIEEQQREAPMRMIDPTSYAYDGPAERRLPERRG